MDKLNHVAHLGRAVIVAGSASLLTVAGLVVAGDATATASTARPVDRERILEKAQQPLDPRIKPGQITQLDPPALPESVTQPLPNVFRIAEQPGQVPIDREHWEQARAAISKGVAFLRAGQDASGGWSIASQAAPTDQPDAPSPVAVAITALALKAVAQADPAAVNDEYVHRTARFIQRARAEDGSYAPGTMTNYVTSTVVMALASVDRADFADDLRRGVTWLQTAQWDQAEGIDPTQDWFGGAGYGRNGRPDLSNTQMMLDALHDAGVSPDEPAVQRALAFVCRAQNLKATNGAAWAGNDGGFVYTPANGGESMASEAAGEGRRGETLPQGQPRSLRSYGSMTYAGFKSMLYAGLSPDDARVRAAFDWIRRHWTFDENPGMGQQGLYYYYHAMARALLASQQTIITDAQGKPHNWREELIAALVKRQRHDGSWLNDADRWMEGDPNLVTAGALLALEECLKPVTSPSP